MAHYVVGDIHGQAELFRRGLESLNFREGRDELYLLGDIVACGQSVWPVFRRLKEAAQSYHFVMGNHESNLLINFLPHASRLRGQARLLEPLLALHRLLLDKPCLPFLADLAPQAYAQDGQRAGFGSQRSPRILTAVEGEELRLAVADLRRALAGDEQLGLAAYRVLSCGLFGFRQQNSYQTLLPELLALPEADYDWFCAFLASQPYLRYEELLGQVQLFIHYPLRRQVHGPEVERGNWFARESWPVLRHPDRADLDAVYYGHMPVLRWVDTEKLDVNPLEILSYTDEQQVRYYNLDLVEGGCLGFLCLEDGAACYVTDPQAANYEY